MIVLKSLGNLAEICRTARTNRSRSLLVLTAFRPNEKREREGQMKVNFHNKMTEFTRIHLKIRWDSLGEIVDAFSWTSRNASRTLRSRSKASRFLAGHRTSQAKTKTRHTINAVRRTQWNVQFAGFTCRGITQRASNSMDLHLSNTTIIIIF